MQTWQIQQAKTHLSALVRATATAPQYITWHGRSVAVVLSPQEYDRLSTVGHSLVEFMRASPLFESEDITLSRTESPPREVAF